jgi:hypothetical protein
MVGWYCVVEIAGFDEREHALHPALTNIDRRSGGTRVRAEQVPLARRKDLVHVVIIVHRQSDLLEVVRALRSLGSFPGGLHRRQQESDENSNDGDHHQQLDERERPPLHMRLEHSIALIEKTDAKFERTVATRKDQTQQSIPHYAAPCLLPRRFDPPTTAATVPWATQSRLPLQDAAPVTGACTSPRSDYKPSCNSSIAPVSFSFRQSSVILRHGGGRRV